MTEGLRPDTLDEERGTRPGGGTLTMAAARASGDLPEIDVSMVDGIRLLHLPTDGPTTVALAFGVGRADEPPHRAGITHLAEHLLMGDLLDPGADANAYTELLRTVFVFRGAPAAASSFLRRVANAIDDLPLGRLDDELEVLRTERAAHDRTGLDGRLAWFRFGHTGLGAAVMPELFVRDPDPAAIRAWVAEHLTADNAVLWVAGEVPADLSVPLARGHRREAPLLRTIPGLRTPTMVVADGLVVAASFLAHRSPGLATGLRVARRRLLRRVRLDQGLAYDVGHGYIPVGPDLAHLTLGATCLDRHVAEVRRALLDAVDGVAAEGPTEAELALDFERLIESAMDPAVAAGRLDAAAADELLGVTPPTLRALLDEQGAVDRSAVSAAMSEAHESMILLTPRTAHAPNRRLHPYPGVTTAPIGEATGFDPASAVPRLPWQRRDGPRLAVGTEGVAIDGPDGGRRVALRWEDCVAVVAEPDGRRVLFGADGYTLGLDPREWRGGMKAIELVDRHGPRERLVRSGRREGAWDDDG